MDVRVYGDNIAEFIWRTEVTGGAKTLDGGAGWCWQAVRDRRSAGKLIFIGNGGSATIASHMAIDFLKNANIPAIALNDPAALTCIGNDLGFESTFAKQVELLANPGDLVILISSSGASPNILAAARAARDRRCELVTLSGFEPDNPLRALGDLNFYVPAGNSRYGYVEIAHLTILHAVLDAVCGLEA